MADGYSQVFDDSGFVVLCFQRHKGLLDNLLSCVYCHSINTTFRLMACKRRKKRKENDMGAIIMSVLVSVIAIVGVIYFNHQDKKEALKNNNKG